MKKITCFIFIIFISSAGHTQDKRIDSLKLLIQKEKKDTAKIRKLIQMGGAYRNIKNDSALVYFRDALHWSEKIGFIQGEIRARTSLADFLFNVKSDYATALALYFKNLKLEEQTGDTTYIFVDTRDVGAIYERIEDFVKEYEYVNKLNSLINSGIFKDSVKLARYRNIADNWFGNVYIKLNKLDSAKFFKLRVFKDGIAKKDWLRIAAGSIGLGYIYRKLKNPDSAFYYYRIGMSAAFNNEKDLYVLSLIGLGNLYWEDNQTDSAFHYGQKAFKFSEKEKDRDQMINAAELLAEIYYAKKQPDSAYKYLHQSMLLKENLFSSEKIARIQNLSLKESLQKLQQEQIKKEAVQKYKSRIKIYSLAAGLAGLLILIETLQNKKAGLKT